MDESTSPAIRIGLAGYGTVGAAVHRNLATNARLIEERTGFRFEVVRVAVRDAGKARDLAPERVTTRWRDLTEDGAIDMVVEVMGGTTEAFDLVVAALAAGKVVVTANKALLAERGAEIFAASDASGCPVFYEAAVAGGIPVIKAVRESLVGNAIRAIHGIINGTSNYILSRMDEAGLEFSEALAEAQARGYAEADPALDVNGWDAGHKAMILASLAYGKWVPAAGVRVEGIEQVGPQDMGYAAKLGFSIKLLAMVCADGSGRIEVGVQPTLVPKNHILASVKGVHNAIVVNADLVGEVMLFGPGAGGDATASSILSDLVDAAHAVRGGVRHPGFVSHGLYMGLLDPGEVVSDFYLRIPVNDQPGVIAGVAGVLAGRGIGIGATVSLPPADMPGGNFTEVILLTHGAKRSNMEGACGEIATLPYVTGRPVLFRVLRP